MPTSDVSSKNNTYLIRGAFAVGVLGIVLAVIIILSAPKNVVNKAKDLAVRPPISDLYDKYGRATVTIYNDAEEKTVLGTGIMLSPNGAFLTNWHSVENVSLKDHLLHLVDVDGAKYPVTDIHSYDQSSDLAFGEAVGVGFATGQLDKSIPVKTGDQVIVIGAPTSSLNNISQGHIVGAQDEQGDSVLEISSSLACADQGCSILNLEGKLIGFTRPVESKTAGLSYASTADEIYTFLSHAQTNTGEQVVP